MAELKANLQKIDKAKLKIDLQEIDAANPNPGHRRIDDAKLAPAPWNTVKSKPKSGSRMMSMGKPDSEDVPSDCPDTSMIGDVTPLTPSDGDKKKKVGQQVFTYEQEVPHFSTLDGITFTG